MKLNLQNKQMPFLQQSTNTQWKSKSDSLQRFGEPLEIVDWANVVRVDMMQIELCSFYISREQAVKLHWSLTLIKSSQQRLILIFEEYKTIWQS